MAPMKAMKAMKAMKKLAEKKKKVEEDEEEHSEEASESDEDEDDEDVAKEEAKKQGEKDKQALVRTENGSAKKAADAQQRIIDKLLRKQDELHKKLKENKAAVRKAEKEMEPLKEAYSKKKRVFNKLKNDKLAIAEEKIASRNAKMRRFANKRLRVAKKREETQKKRIDAITRGNRGVKASAQEAKMALKRAQSKVDDINQQIKSLKAKGEHVPENHREDFSSPHAWKPPGFVAAKALTAAKEVMAKAQAVYNKAAGEFDKKDLKRKAQADKLEEVKKTRLGSSKSEKPESVATPAREASKTKKK